MVLAVNGVVHPRILHGIDRFEPQKWVAFTNYLRTSSMDEHAKSCHDYWGSYPMQ